MDQPHVGYTTLAGPAREHPGRDQTHRHAASSRSLSRRGRRRRRSRFAGLRFAESAASYIDVFNKGREPFNFTATAGATWITLSQPAGRVEDEVDVRVSVDWESAGWSNAKLGRNRRRRP
jgi:hypothetical protein